MRKSKRYSTLLPKNPGSSWKMRATRLEHRRVEGKK